MVACRLTTSVALNSSSVASGISSTRVDGVVAAVLRGREARGLRDHGDGGALPVRSAVCEGDLGGRSRSPCRDAGGVGVTSLRMQGLQGVSLLMWMLVVLPRTRVNR